MADNRAWLWNEEVEELPFDGSAARSPQIAPPIKKEPTTVARPRVLEQPKAQPKEQPNKATTEEAKLKKLSIYLTLASVMFLFLGGLLVIQKYGDNYAKERSVKSLNTQLREETDLTNALKKQATQVETSADVYNRAILELQMQKATGDDVIVITITEMSETISYLTEEEPERSITYHGFAK